MTTGDILNACLGFAQEASADGSDLYRPLHSQYRFCLEDLREVAASDTREEIGDALAGLLEDADPVIEFHTILELGRLNYRGATSHIVEALQSDDWRVVVSAARVLGAVGDASHQQALLDVMEATFGIDYMAAEDSYLHLGGEIPANAEHQAWYDGLSSRERREFDRDLNMQRRFVREQYAALSDSNEADIFWAADRNNFPQMMGSGIDFETGEFAEACPEQIFVDEGGLTVNLTLEPPLDQGIFSPGNQYEFDWPGGGRLVGERDTNPQWLGAGPSELKFVSASGEETPLYWQPISFFTPGGIILAGPGEGPSNGAILQVSVSDTGSPRLTKLFELPGRPVMAARMDKTRFAVMTLQQTAYAFDADGSVEPLQCQHWVEQTQ